MPVLRVINYDRRKKDSIYLLESQNNIYSQAGEDGIIKKIFEIMQPKNKWCVEFGAWDGILYSNTCNLLRNEGWTCVQIEGSARKFADLEINFRSNERSIRLHKIIGYTENVDTIDHVLSETDIPVDFDLISIDIDGNDWHIWNSIKKYRPRVVVIEYNQRVPNDVVFIQDKDFSINEGCSLSALIELGKKKRYELICATALNGIFVVAEEFEKFGIADNSIDAMRSDGSSDGRIFGTYSGKIYHTMRKVGWGLKGRDIKPDAFQLLTAEEMKFGDRLGE